jgi:hypothetical protein
VCDEKEQKANPHVPLPIFLLFFLFLKKLRRFHLTHGELSVDHVPLFNWSNQIRKPWRSAFSKSARNPKKCSVSNLKIKGAFGSRHSPCCHSRGRAASAVDKTATRQLTSYGARYELAVAARAKPFAMCGGRVWQYQRVARAACVGRHSNVP